MMPYAIAQQLERDQNLRSRFRKYLTNLEEVLKYSILAPNQIRTVIQAYKGRGTRVISRDELHKVTPDAPGKSRFVLVDCVGVTETDKTETKSHIKMQRAA